MALGTSTLILTGYFSLLVCLSVFICPFFLFYLGRKTFSTYILLALKLESALPIITLELS